MAKGKQLPVPPRSHQFEGQAAVDQLNRVFERRRLDNGTADDGLRVRAITHKIPMTVLYTHRSVNCNRL